jgi:glutathione synthase/RimK-type ligase-like ATP-grasp enzyme
MKDGGVMKLAIIYPDQEGWTVDRFRESAKLRDIEVETVTLTDELVATGQVDKQIATADAVLWKFANATLASFLASYPILKNKVLINTGVVLMPSATDKFLQQQLLGRSTLREYAVPTYRVRNGEHVELLIEDNKLSYPLIIKPAWGTNAQGVYIISSVDDMAKVKTWQSQIAEPFIQSTEEWRVFVIGGIAAGMMKKHRRDGADPSSTIIGGGARNVAETDTRMIAKLSDIAEKVAALFHLEYAGIDIVRDQQTKQFYIYEANSAAGWQNGFVEATGEDIPGQVLDWFEERLVLKRTNDIAGSVGRYLRNRSHRLATIDELLLIGDIQRTSPETDLILRARRIIGADYGPLRQAIQDEVNQEVCTTAAFLKLLMVIDSIQKYDTVALEVILGDDLYSQVQSTYKALVTESGSSDGDRMLLYSLFKRIFKMDPGIPTIKIDLAVDSVTLQNIDTWVRYLQAGLGDSKTLIDAIDLFVGDRFMQLPLEILLDFGLAARQAGGKSRFEAPIISRAESSVSWAGNFLIDEIDSMVGVSTAHTMRQGYQLSVRYIQLVSLAAQQGL